jgi:hypothetical protein
MELSYFLAQIFGLLLIIFSIAFLFRPIIVTVAIRDLRPFSFTMLLAGLLGVTGGLFIILTHPIWEFSWRGIITLFGWIMLFKGVMYIAFPDTLRFTATSMVNGIEKRTVMLLLILVLGCYLTLHGFKLW